MQQAKRESCRGGKAPQTRAALPYERMFEPEEIEALRWGHVPSASSDHWHVFMEGNWLYLRDVDTPHYTYWLLLEHDGDAWQVGEAWASREFGECCDTLAADLKLLDDQLELLLAENAHLAGPATKESWPCKPMPQETGLLHYERHLSQGEYETLLRGLVPESGDDHWFVYMQGEWVCLHRSWTGECVFMVRLTPTDDGWRAAETWVNGDRSQFPETSEHKQIEMLDEIIDRLTGRKAT